MTSVFVISADLPVAFEFSSDSAQDVETFVTAAMRENRVVSLQVGDFNTSLINFGGVRQAMVVCGDNEEVERMVADGDPPVVRATLEDLRDSA